MSSVKHTPPTENTWIELDGHSLILDDVESVALGRMQAKLADSAVDTVQHSSMILKQLADSHSPIYGVNTGFGIFADQRIEAEQSIDLSRNLILSHVVGTGPPFPEETVRAAMLIRANTLALGHSGVRPVIIETLLGMLNQHVTPYIPSQGSLGSSGDLAPLAHLALTLSAPPNDRDNFDGKAWLRGKLMSGAEAMKSAGLERPVLGPKEGLALTNGATFSAAILALACIHTERLLESAMIAASLSFEALMGVSSALDERLHAARPHRGQTSVAQRMRALLQGSTLTDRSDRIQDAYSLRCTPQIVGPVWDTLHYVHPIIHCEINSVTDNPILLDEQVISGGNFHGEPLGLSADYLKIALTVLGALSERRTYRLISKDTNAGLTPMLVAKKELAGLHSGLMMLQYTAASLALENKSFASPDSLHSLPTSAGQEDLNANSTTAARHLEQVITNTSKIIAVELIVAAQALELRLQQYPDAQLGLGTSLAYQWLRDRVAFCAKDRPLADEIENIAQALLKGAFIPEMGM